MKTDGEGAGPEPVKSRGDAKLMGQLLLLRPRVKGKRDMQLNLLMRIK